MRIPVSGENGCYSIILERGALSKTAGYLDLQRKVLVVTDSGVPEVYAETVARQCKEAVVCRFPMGEQHKTLDTFRLLLEEMAKAGFTRKDCVVAVGGGVVGDISGFAASCYMRGIDFYNIPTTLLSQVDSSIGGKTAVDFEGYKNLVGSFYNPKQVLIDPDLLSTLDPRLFGEGLAEVIKMAATSDSDLFRLLEETEDITAVLPDIIGRSLLIKKSVVEQDPKEQGLRRVLNFGHTLGHAVEALSHGSLYHGECVAIGMVPMCGDKVRKRLAAVLTKYHLPTTCHLSPADLLPAIRHDKKAEATGIKAVEVPEIGQFRFVTLTAEELAKRMEEPV